jgi:hypothetical protein
MSHLQLHEKLRVTTLGARLPLKFLLLKKPCLAGQDPVKRLLFRRFVTLDQQWNLSLGFKVCRGICGFVGGVCKGEEKRI